MTFNFFVAQLQDTKTLGSVKCRLISQPTQPWFRASLQSCDGRATHAAPILTSLWIPLVRLTKNKLMVRVILQRILGPLRSFLQQFHTGNPDFQPNPNLMNNPVDEIKMMSMQIHLLLMIENGDKVLKLFIFLYFYYLEINPKYRWT